MFVVLPNGDRLEIPHVSCLQPEAAQTSQPAHTATPIRPGDRTAKATLRRPLGCVCGARSGDKGGNANVGLWTRNAASFEWLRNFLTVDRFKELFPETSGLPVERHRFPNLLALNFVVVGLLGLGVSASTRSDPQAKGFGEFVRSRVVDIPGELVEGR